MRRESFGHAGCACLLGAPGSLREDGWQGTRWDLHKGHFPAALCWERGGQERRKATFLPLGGLGTNPAHCLHTGPVLLAAWDSGLPSLAHQK